MDTIIPSLEDMFDASLSNRRHAVVREPSLAADFSEHRRDPSRALAPRALALHHHFAAPVFVPFSRRRR
jgi:hypothetical protein